MKVLLLLGGAAALTAPTLAPPSVLDGLAQLAQRAVAAPEYRDPRDGTWGDNPVGGAAERDGSWLDQDTRAAIKAGESPASKSVSLPMRGSSGFRGESLALRG